MSPAEKKATWQRIDLLHDEASTNLWAGIRTGLDLFSQTPLVDNVQGLYLLTDGMPNYMRPLQGYIAKLGHMLHSAGQEGSGIPTIHTFGFGYQIRSELMQSIAEVGNGTYAFIPDAGMIGTAFVHSVANLLFHIRHVCDARSQSVERHPSGSYGRNVFGYRRARPFVAIGQHTIRPISRTGVRLSERDS
ncbi:hypothetical protein LTR41_012140 [Exophiala xenobiotica]|nr:hypothetical protein LTR41_012140 [Exophiala xenobiotica]KAK5546711.1 hypothetical protein LTR46_012039 [Exophiala xenobiotica]